MSSEEDKLISKRIVESSRVIQLLEGHVEEINLVATTIKEALVNGYKILICGNGGSAAEAQHVAAEFMGRFKGARSAWPVLALTTDSSFLTAYGNDVGFEYIFARQIEALGQKGDVVVGISTSGNSEDVLLGMKMAHDRGCTTIGLTGESGGLLEENVDICFHAPSDVTSKIQEANIVMWHIVCELFDGPPYEFTAGQEVTVFGEL